jgi:hypothetical protein
MAKVFDAIDSKLREFIENQHVFFVATAPLSPDGLINLSPKGLSGTLSVVDEQTIAYLDLTGSGVETIAHVRENERICVMFCAFEGPPRIVRVHGRADVLEPHDQEFEALRGNFGDHPGTRSIVRIRATRISDSCGFGVPRYEYESERDQLQRWAERKGPEGIAEYQRENNAESIDGLPSSLGDH